jgi:hypothetical protein
VPGPPSAEICDGLDNDCDGILPEDELDRDADGLRACSGDCEDLFSFTYPGAPEVHDQEDNQCPGDPGFGIVDEISGIAGFLDPEDGKRFSWPPQEGAISYEVLRSESSWFADCTRLGGSEAYRDDSGEPDAGTVWYYLVQATVPTQGSYGVDFSGTERSALCGIEWDCTDLLDDDGDGVSDCLDPDCYGKAGCTTAEYYEFDTFGDDIGAQDLETWLRQIALRPTDHLLFFVGEVGLLFFVSCAERADFYVGRYLALAPTGGEALSGSWQKWHKLDFAEWIGPITDGFPNRFGSNCAGPYSWCHDAGLGGHGPGVAPSEEGICEVFDDTTCGDGNTSVWIVVGTDRRSACGF